MHRDKVEALAKGWRGTPFAHQQRLKSVAADCVGLILGVGIEGQLLDYTEARWARFKGYRRIPNPRQLREFCEVFLVPSATAPGQIAAVGSVALIAWRPGVTLHFAIRSRLADGRPAVIHASSEHGRTVEHALVAEWRGFVHSWWDFPRTE